MLQDTINERIEALAKVRDEIRMVRTTLTNMEEFERELESQVKQLQSISAKEQEPKFSKMFQRYRNMDNAEKVHVAEQERRPKAVRDTAYEVLKRNSQPIWEHYAELKKQVEAEGVQIGGQRPDDNFMNHLSQDERFIRKNGRALWSLREWFPNHVHDEATQQEIKIGN
jgi:hypothetical protein